MRASLPAEMRAFLDEHGPATAPEIALGIRARRVDVDHVLASGAFSRSERPKGASPNAAYFVSSPVVPRPRSLKSGRADAFYSLFADGIPHSRAECQQAVGVYTNNAAAELRRRGDDVRYDRKTDSYQLVASAKPGASSPLPTLGGETPRVSGFADANERSAA